MILGKEKAKVMTEAALRYTKQFQIEHLLKKNPYELSGGEKQRISIARAILKDAPIIILDEATSSVDPENEQALLSAIQELTKDKTLISIAHRLSTVRNADQIIVIDHGRIIQRGTHEELLSIDGMYRRFLSLRTEAAGWHL